MHLPQPATECVNQTKLVASTMIVVIIMIIIDDNFTDVISTLLKNLL